MKQFGIITLFPEMFTAISAYGITGRACEQGLININTWNPRNFTEDKHKTVDDRPYGGGPGMVMMAKPVSEAIHYAKASMKGDVTVIHLTPQGKRLNQKGIEILRMRQKLLMLCGRYEGIDERVLDKEIDEEWSIGDYVLSGGELASMVLIDTITRTIPGALGHENSASEDSFFNGLLDFPHYTRPEVVDGRKIPDILLSGNHELIRRWRLQQALGRTWIRRPDLLEKIELDKEQAELLEEFKSKNEINSN